MQAEKQGILNSERILAFKYGDPIFMMRDALQVKSSFNMFCLGRRGRYSRGGNRRFIRTFSRLIKTDAGLPTKDETSEPIIRNLYRLVPYIYDSLQLKTCFLYLLIIKNAIKKL